MTTMMMLHSVLLLATTTLLFLPSASSTSSTSSLNRIIGGQPTPSSHHHSYTISLQHYSNHICGGSLILKDVVLTAAHCVINEDYVVLDVVIGRDNDLLSGGAAAGGGQYDESSSGGGGREQQQQSRSVPVKQRWIHPKYNRTTFEYDFAILLLDHPIHQIIIIDDTSNNNNNNNDTSSNSNGDDEQVSSAAVPIQLVTLNPNNTYPPPGTTSHVLGWGDTTGNKTFTNILQMANVNVITNTECSAATRNNNDGTGGTSSSGSSYKGCIYDSMICTFQEGKDSCQGDSGGPVIVQQEQQHLNGTTATTVDVQIGVVSWGYGCAQMPGVDSRVSMGYDWIQDTACGWSNDTSGSSLCDDDDDDDSSMVEEELQSSTPTYQPSNTAVPTTTSSSALSKSSAVPTFEAGNRVDPEDQSSSSSPTAVAVEGEPSSSDDDDIISSLAPTTSSTPYPSSSSSSSAAPMIVITNTPTLYLATIRNEDGEEDSNDVSSSSNAPSTFPTWVLPNPSPTNVVIE